MDIETLSSTIASSVAEAWGTLFMKEVSLTSGMIDEVEGFIAAPGSYISCELDFEGDIAGHAKWFIPQTEALTMVGMMMAMGADDELVKSTREGTFGEDELDAIKEAFNQLCSTSATVIRDNKGADISGSIKEPEVTEVELGLTGGDIVIPLTLELEGFEKTTIYQVIDSELKMGLNSSPKPPDPEPVIDLDDPSPSAPQKQTDLNRLSGISLGADLILAERNMDLENLLTLCVGSVLEFWKPCDAPAELCIQDATVASGEVVLCANQHFGLRVINLAPKRQSYDKGAS